MYSYTVFQYHVTFVYTICFISPVQAVADPEKSIRRKHKKNELKKASKKMKILQYRPDSTAAVIASRKSKQRHR